MSSFPGCRCSALLGAVAPLNTAARYRLRQQLVCSEYFRAPPAGPWFVRPAQQPLRGSALSSADAVGGALGRRCVRGDGVAEGQPVRHGLGPAGGGAGHRGGPMGALGGRALASTALCEPMYFLHQRRLRAPPSFGHLRSPGWCAAAPTTAALFPPPTSWTGTAPGPVGAGKLGLAPPVKVRIPRHHLLLRLLRPSRLTIVRYRGAGRKDRGAGWGRLCGTSVRSYRAPRRSRSRLTGGHAARFPGASALILGSLPSLKPT